MSLTHDDKTYIKDTMTNSLIAFWDEVLEKKFDGIEKKFDGIESKMFTKEGAKSMEARLMKSDQNTRDYVDTRVMELKGDLVSYDKKIIEKVDTLTATLAQKHVITQAEHAAIIRLSPFPVTSAVGKH